MIRRPPRSTHCISSAASDVYKRQVSTQSTWEQGPINLPQITKKVPNNLDFCEKMRQIYNNEKMKLNYEQKGDQQSEQNKRIKDFYEKRSLKGILNMQERQLKFLQIPENGLLDNSLSKILSAKQQEKWELNKENQCKLIKKNKNAKSPNDVKNFIQFPKVL
eukprot:TRINITY_DN28324_c0_g1_i2.p2 TRINITY_DN28324_c0_g1~~TRINITY_DN28324_c0_g1_i2.p2  ORF type:complete len:162 (+),score=54.17 TRINITY_DN28324_c0_g1_i2:133-618(+)